MSARRLPLGSSGRRALAGRARAAAALALLALAAGACGGSASGRDAPLRVALVPNQRPEKVRGEYEPLGRYLERELGRPVELSVPASYPAVVEAMANDKVDLALFGGLTYVQARRRARVVPLVTDVNPEMGTTKYDAVIVVPAASPVRRLGQLRGRDFAFGSVSSTSGSLYPARMLARAGIDYRSDLGRVLYTGGHDATAAAVAGGKVDAGGLEGRILRRLVRDGAVDGRELRTIATSPPIEGYPWVARASLAAALRERIARAFTSMRDRRLLAALHARGYRRVEPSDYDEIERSAERLGLLTRGG